MHIHWQSLHFSASPYSWPLMASLRIRRLVLNKCKLKRCFFCQLLSSKIHIYFQWEGFEPPPPQTPHWLRHWNGLKASRNELWNASSQSVWPCKRSSRCPKLLYHECWRNWSSWSSQKPSPSSLGWLHCWRDQCDRRYCLHTSRTYTTVRFDSRAFRVSAPKLWNTLPLHIRQSQSLSAFRRHLKTQYFQLAYPAT